MASSRVVATGQTSSRSPQGDRISQRFGLRVSISGRCSKRRVCGDTLESSVFFRFIAVDLAENSRLMIEQVDPGLVADWNKANSGKEVKPGDRIMSMNGTKDDAGAMAAVCQESRTSELLIRRE